jgi:hypothetical protein
MSQSVQSEPTLRRSRAEIVSLEDPCITRGRCGSLPLHRDGLPPFTFCRSPGTPVHYITFCRAQMQ